jgi:DNA-binding LacI/PurR family transcriptional regulator
MKKPTIIDIAKDSGFSKSTVSLALRGGANLKKSSKEKILKSAKKLNYY